MLYFLKTVHGDEWTSFLERVGVQPKDEARLWQDRKLALELRLWASFRGQTLVRTVEGGMLLALALALALAPTLALTLTLTLTLALTRHDAPRARAAAAGAVREPRGAARRPARPLPGRAR